MSHRPFQLGLLADALGRAGRRDEAVSAIAEGLRLSTTTGECFWEAELHRLRGELAYDADPEEAFAASLRVARQQSAKALELRAVSSWSRRHQRGDRRAEARKRLAAIYHWFTEGFATPDMCDAKALLEELA